MGLEDLQTHIVQSIPDATGVVDLLKLPDRRGSLQFVIDGECCLDRLYGGYYPDWVCGGQWNKMDQFLCNFSSVVQTSKLDLVVFLDGSLETERLSEWCNRQQQAYRYLQEIHQHVSMKRKPPPKIWWIPPAFLRSAIRIAFRSLNMNIACSMEDHHKDILRFVKKAQFNGIIGDSSEYLIFEPNRYFSAQKLKLTFKGSLETVEMKLTNVYSALNVPKDRFYIFATLVGNHIILENDLRAFYSTLDIPEAQPKGAVIEAVAQFVRALETTDRGRILDLILEKSHSESTTDESLETLRQNLMRSFRYYGSINGKTPNSTNTRPASKNTQRKKEKPPVQGAESGGGGDAGSSIFVTSTNSVLPSDGQDLDMGTNVSNVFEDGDGNDGGADASGSGGATVPKIPGVFNGNGGGDASSVDKPKDVSSFAKLIYRVAPQIDNVAMNRHRCGVMSPYIYQILKQKEIRLPVLIEDINAPFDLPQIHHVFRPLRQRVYAILFNLHHLHFLAKERAEPVPKIEVKETYYDPITKQAKTDVIRAVEIGWGVPTVERLWLGDGDECKRKRVRAFLSAMKSDKQIFLDGAVVPQQLLVLCCVLRYLVYDKKFLREIEFDGLIAQALIQKLTDVNVAQDIEVSNLTMRGVHISHMFMEGIEMALLVNDACGSPIPFMLFAPWLFFNGKIFNYVLEEQAAGKTIAEICGFKMDIVYDMGRIKTAILDGINVQFASNLYAYSANVPGPLLNSLMQGQFGRNPTQLSPGAVRQGIAGRGGGPPVRRNAGGLVANPGVLRHSGFVGYGNEGHYGYETSRIPGNPQYFMDDYGRVDRRGQGRGAQLQVAGTVVGSWGANYSQPSNPRRQVPGFFGTPPSPANYVRRNPFGYPHEHVNSNVAMDLAFRQMTISHGQKVPIRAHSSNWNARGNGRPQSKHQKKSIMKKNENPDPGRNETSGGDGGMVGSSSRAKGVSFREDTLHNCIPSTSRNGDPNVGVPE